MPRRYAALRTDNRCTTDLAKERKKQADKRDLSLGFHREQRVHVRTHTTRKHHHMSTNTDTAIPATQNESWGFWGTMRGYASVAWPLAMTAIAEATGESLDAVRAFLDSKAGRHFADEVSGHQYHGQALPDAITTTVAAWMRMTIKRRTAIDYGIPQGLPYLTGFVMHAAIHDETAERG
jgi:hypothetical protein